MGLPFILVLVGLTSVGAYLVGARALGLSGSGVREAIGAMFECVGMTLVFLVVNLALGMVVILAARQFTRGFVPLYLAADEAFLALSLLQGLTFRWWQEASRRRRT